MRYVNKNKRQFIAGAVCPNCKAQDTIVQITSSDDEHIECVVCGYTEGRPDVDKLSTADQDTTNDAQVGIVRFKN